MKQLIAFISLITTTSSAEIVVYSQTVTNRIIGNNIDRTYVSKGYLVVDVDTFEARSVSYFTFGNQKFVTTRSPDLHISQVSGANNVKYTVFSEVWSGFDDNETYWTASQYGRGPNRSVSITGTRTVGIPTLLTGIGRVQGDGDEISAVGESRGALSFARQATLSANSWGETPAMFSQRWLNYLQQQGYTYQASPF